LRSSVSNSPRFSDPMSNLLPEEASFPDLVQQQ
jgi:hypothetical protein